jgi:GT2 family glycosyltransferase
MSLTRITAPALFEDTSRAAHRGGGTESLSVWVVILNWNGLADTLACLESLQHAATDGVKLSALVVDNASMLDPRPALHAAFPEVELLASPRNLGFAGGCNLGMQRALDAGADYVLLLNNDTTVDPAFLTALLEYSRSRPQAGIVGPLICHAKQPEQLQAAGGALLLALGHGYHIGDGTSRSSAPVAPFAADYLSGCCMLIPATTIRAVGCFDEGYFAYFEDVDYCLRAQRFGLATVCVPASVIWHSESASTRRGLASGTTSPLKHYLVTRNRVRLVLRHGALWERLIFLLAVVPLGGTLFLAAFAIKRRWTKLAWFVRGLIDGLQGRGGPPPAEATRQGAGDEHPA